jgi:hypothetical protein
MSEDTNPKGDTVVLRKMLLILMFSIATVSVAIGTVIELSRPGNAACESNGRNC